VCWSTSQVGDVDVCLSLMCCKDLGLDGTGHKDSGGVIVVVMVVVVVIVVVVMVVVVVVGGGHGCGVGHCSGYSGVRDHCGVGRGGGGHGGGGGGWRSWLWCWSL